MACTWCCMQFKAQDLCPGERSSRHLSAIPEDSFLSRIMAYMFDMRPLSGWQHRHPPFFFIILFLFLKNKQL